MVRPPSESAIDCGSWNVWGARLAQVAMHPSRRTRIICSQEVTLPNDVDFADSHG